MTAILLTFVLTTAAYAALMWIGIRRILAHMRCSPEAQKAITFHVLAPLFGGHGEPEPEAKPAAKPTPQVQP